MPGDPPPLPDYYIKAKEQKAKQIVSSFFPSSLINTQALIGWDSQIFLVSILSKHPSLPENETELKSPRESENETELKSPRESDNTRTLVVRFSSHLPSTPSQNPRCQAWIYSQIRATGERMTPNLISVGDDYLVEEFFEGRKLKGSPPSACSLVLSQLGRTLRNIHSVKTKGYGRFIKRDGNEEWVGSYPAWFSFFHDVFVKRWEWAKEEKLFSEEITIKLDALYLQHKPYLQSFQTPSLVHADLCTENIIIRQEKGTFQLSGIIDFGDALSGDPLYDLAEIFYFSGVNWNLLEPFLSAYSENSVFTEAQKKIVEFYELFLSVFYIFDDSVYIPKNKPRVKWHVLKGYTNVIKSILKSQELSAH